MPFRLLLAAVLSCLLAPLAGAATTPLQVVAAESTYASIAQAIGGDQVRVTAIIQNPNADPHAFEASPQAARLVATARVVVYNGLGYDDWMRQMLQASPAPGRQVIMAAALAGDLILPDRNPHVFYDTRVARRVATRLAALFEADDPLHRALFAANLVRFAHALDGVDSSIGALAGRHPRLTLAATEPVFGYMIHRLGWVSLGATFQLNIMNGTEPAPAVVAHFEDSLRAHRAALLIYNRQVSQPLTTRMRAVAQAAGIPEVGVDEFVPPGMDYPTWLHTSLAAVARAADASHGR